MHGEVKFGPLGCVHINQQIRRVLGPHIVRGLTPTQCAMDVLYTQAQTLKIRPNKIVWFHQTLSKGLYTGGANNLLILCGILSDQNLKSNLEDRLNKLGRDIPWLKPSTRATLGSSIG